MNIFSRKHLVPSFFVAASLTMIGCVGLPNSTPCSGVMTQSCYPGMMTQNLCSAGFVPMSMNACETGLFEALPPNQITTIQRNGNSYYVYADQSSHQVLMGQSSALKSSPSIAKELPSAKGVERQAGREWKKVGI